jgi:Right handed beta helix region
VRRSHVALLGDGGALLVLAPPDSRLNKEAILVNPASRLEDIAVSGLSIQVNNGASGPSSQGVIQINRCAGCLVEDVHMFWDPGWPAATPKPHNCDGIVFALGSTGWIRNSVVDGIPKAGIYVAAALRPEDGTTDVRVERCEVKNGTVSGIGVGGFSRAFISACDVHDNAGIGLNIGGGDASNPLRDMSVKVVGGVFSNNGTGININIVATRDPLPPKNIRLVGSTVVDNTGSGVVIRAAEDVRLEGVTLSSNGASGIAIADPDGPEVLVRRVGIFDTLVSHNSVSARAPGILLRGSADLITIAGGTVADDTPTRTQRVAIQIAPDAAAPPRYPTNMEIADVDARGDVAIYTVPPP